MVSIAWSLPFCFMLSLSSSASVCVSNDRGSITSTSLTIRGRNPDRLLPKGKNDRRVRWIVDPYFGIWGMHTVGIHQRSRSMTNAVTSSDIPPNIRCDACPCYNESTSDDSARPGPDEVPIWSYLRGYVRTVLYFQGWRIGWVWYRLVRSVWWVRPDKVLGPESRSFVVSVDPRNQSVRLEGSSIERDRMRR